MSDRLTNREVEAAAIVALGISAGVTSQRALDNLGLRISYQDCVEDYARRCRPHLLRSKKRRQRKKALKKLRWILTPEERAVAFQSGVMRMLDHVQSQGEGGNA